MIRRAEPRDAQAIADIQNPFIRETDITFTTEERDPNRLRDELACEAASVWVVEEQGTVVGFAGYGPFRSGPGYRFTAEHAIYVAEHVRGKGLAEALLKRVEHEAARAGIKTLVAGISATNARGLRFHARHGYIETARMPGVGWKFDAPQTLVLLQKSLSPNAAAD